jgi:hypothetical protein
MPYLREISSSHKPIDENHLSNDAPGTGEVITESSEVMSDVVNTIQSVKILKEK